MGALQLPHGHMHGEARKLQPKAPARRGPQRRMIVKLGQESLAISEGNDLGAPQVKGRHEASVSHSWPDASCQRRRAPPPRNSRP